MCYFDQKNTLTFLVYCGKGSPSNHLYSVVMLDGWGRIIFIAKIPHCHIVSYEWLYHCRDSILIYVSMIKSAL